MTHEEWSASRPDGMVLAPTLGDIHAAMTDLRAASADQSLAHAVRAGRFQLQRVTYDSQGRGVVEVLSGWRGATEHIEDIRRRTNEARSA